MNEIFSKYKYTVAITSAVINLAFVFPSFAGVVSPNTTYGGKTQYQWSADWWKTFLEASSSGNSLVSSDSDSTKLETINNPSSPVFFLTGSLVPSIQPIDRTVTILGNKAIFFPVYNGFNADPILTPSELCSNISSVAPVTGNSLSATLDGAPIGGNLIPWRQNCNGQPDTDSNGQPSQPNTNSGGFVVNELPGSLLQVLAGDNKTLPYNFVSDGYWLLLTPLTPGEHIMNFGAKDSQGNTLQDNTYKITVVSAPEPSFLLSLLAVGTFGASASFKRKLAASKLTKKK